MGTAISFLFPCPCSDPLCDHETNRSAQESRHRPLPQMQLSHNDSKGRQLRPMLQPSSSSAAASEQRTRTEEADATTAGSRATVILT